MKFSIVVGCDEARGIGRGGELPWRIPRDMAHFVRLTKSAPPGRRNAVVMGRVTWESIPDRFRPLGGRCNIVLSRNTAALPGADRVCASIPAAIEAAIDLRAFHTFVIGGAAIYEKALLHPGCNALFVTRIEGDFGCDRFFPDWRGASFRLDATLESGESGGHPYRVERWLKQ